MSSRISSLSTQRSRLRSSAIATTVRATRSTRDRVVGRRGGTACMTPELERLAARLQRVEDELAIRRLILSYGPAADAGETGRAGALWADDGEYDWDPSQPALQGPDAVDRML